MSTDTDTETNICAACGKATALVDGICARCTRDSRPDAGAVAWNYRRPRRVGNETHWLAIEIDREIRYQRPPPCHAHGAAPRADSDDVHLLQREITEAEAERALRVDAAARLLDGATPEQRAALSLREVERMSIPQIARTLGITEPAVKERLKRGRAAVMRARRA